MKLNFKSQFKNLNGIYSALFEAAEIIYSELKKGSGLNFVNSINESGDDQIGLDVIADEAFFNSLKINRNVRYIVSEERPSLNKISNGAYSIALDPLDGSKSALVGIPSGAIFGVFESVEFEHDFNGKNIVAGGFFVFGMNLEVYFADGNKVYQGILNPQSSLWNIRPIKGTLPSANFFAVNASNQQLWHEWLQNHYANLLGTDGGKQKPHNLRWYASMVSEIKRLILQGGVFAYPSDTRTGYENGHLRLVYEAIPMSFLIEAMGGASTNGDKSILDVSVEKLHQKTSVFIGEKNKITAIETAKQQS